MSKIDTCETATEVTKSVTILLAIKWIAHGWDLVKPDTIKKCYQKGGILNKDFNVVRHQGEEEDPFDNIDLAVDTTEIESIMPHIQADSCSVSEYLAGDDDIPICEEFDNEHLEEEFLSSLTSSSEPVSADSGNEDDYDVEELPVFKVRNMSEAILNLED